MIGWDIETNVVATFWNRRVRTIQFGNSEEQYVIDLLAFCYGDQGDTSVFRGKFHMPSDVLVMCQGEYGVHLHRAPGLKPVLDLITPIITSQSFLKVGVSLSFEYESMYWCFGIRSCGFFDCALVDRVIWAGLQSLKEYAFFSMDSLTERYFNRSVDKDPQKTFDLVTPLTRVQIDYGGGDTRIPLAIMRVQTLILEGHTADTARQLQGMRDVSPLVMGDNLVRVAQLENDAIGAFVDMHLHGERIDREKWLTRMAGKQAEKDDILFNILDPMFKDIPGIGLKTDSVTAEEVLILHDVWKKLTEVPPEETLLLGEVRRWRKTHREYSDELKAQLEEMVTARKTLKDHHKHIWNEKSKRLTKLKDLIPQCEGLALINYNSSAQMLVVLNEFFPEIGERIGKKLENLDDDVLDEMSDIPVMGAIWKLHKVAKDINTYGEAWTKEFPLLVEGKLSDGTPAMVEGRPSKKNGWLFPMDGRLHCNFNQYDAETGRSSSTQPNGQNIPRDKLLRSCFIADDADEDAPEGYVIVTADMSGAELRILAELADEEVWLDAFNRGEDVHSVCVELMNGGIWKQIKQPDCAYYALTPDGEFQRFKCECEAHKLMRTDYKEVNFGLPYGMGPGGLGKKIGLPMEEASILMSLHSRTFPKVSDYLLQSGHISRIMMKSFDMFGRRRLFPVPVSDVILRRAMVQKEQKLRLPELQAEANIAAFRLNHGGRKPTPAEKWQLIHRQPTPRELEQAKMGMYGSIERQGKNHAIQGTNASIAKVAMGCGHSADGKPYLWHTLRQFKARLVKFVHDELVVQCPKRYGEEVAALIGDAFKRAGEEVLSKVTMNFEYAIATHWVK